MNQRIRVQVLSMMKEKIDLLTDRESQTALQLLEVESEKEHGIILAKKRREPKKSHQHLVLQVQNMK